MTLADLEQVIADTVQQEQHHDHIWVTFGGVPWAIRSIIRDSAGKPVTLRLWRNPSPVHVAFMDADVSDVDWPLYCDWARAMIDHPQPERN